MQSKEEPQISPEQSAENLVAKRRSILDQIELEKSRLPITPPLEADSVAPIHPLISQPPKKILQIDVPKRRVSALDEIERETPKNNSEKWKLKQKEKTLNF